MMVMSFTVGTGHNFSEADFFSECSLSWKMYQFAKQVLQEEYPWYHTEEMKFGNIKSDIPSELKAKQKMEDISCLCA